MFENDYFLFPEIKCLEKDVALKSTDPLKQLIVVRDDKACRYKCYEMLELCYFWTFYPSKYNCILIKRVDEQNPFIKMDRC